MLRAARETREHTDSYYAASAGARSVYPALTDHLTTDVVIVGGGFSGVSTAVELSERGFDVVLLEANRIGWGASGRNGGQVIGGVADDPQKFSNDIGEDGVKAVHQMGFECVDIIRERVDKYAIDCHLAWGFCDVALKRRHMDEFRESVAYRERIGTPFNSRLLNKDELREYVNSSAYIGGCYNDGWGHLHPLKLCVGEARAADNLGAKIYEQSRVREIGFGARPVVRTDGGSVTADQVVLCGNAYMGRLVPRLSSRILPATSCVIATEPLSDAQVAASLPRNVAVCDARTALDYFRLSADRRMLFGGMANYTGLAPANIKGAMRKKMLKVFPGLADAGIEFGWSGQIGISLRRMPQMGALDENVRFVQGYSGHGVAPTHIMGRVLAEAITGNSERFDILSAIAHPPFPGGRMLRRPGLALGMLFYKIRDAF